METDFVWTTRWTGFLWGLSATGQGYLGKDYPKYPKGQYMGIGGKLYGEGLIKMNEMVMFCGRDRVPILWFQDTSGIDVGDIAEEAELLGLGQSLIYSIESSHLPMMCVVLRNGTAPAHYMMGGPQATRNNAFTVGVGTTEIYVMHGETASVAAFARRLVKEKDSAKPIEPVIDSMNASLGQGLVAKYAAECAHAGMDAPQVIAATNAIIPKTRTYGLVGSLEYSVRGGACHAGSRMSRTGWGSCPSCTSHAMAA